MRVGTLALSFIVPLTLLFGAGVAAAQEQVVAAQSQSAGAGTLFGAGVNFGNALEAPQEGWWGLTLEESHVAAVAAAGFQTIRLPVKWSGHAADAPPFDIEPAFLARVDEVVGWALGRGLNVILDFHHYDEMATDPGAHQARWLGIWRQLALHYRDAPQGLAFELLNEPSQALGPDLWNEMVSAALAVIRESNPDRWVVIGPTDWNAIGALAALAWPDDPRIVLTVHYYDPFAFTHQGAEWVPDTPPVGRAWTGDQLAPLAPWQDWSWDARRDYTDELTITFTAGWGGYYLHPPTPVAGYESLIVSVSRDVELLISCGDTGESAPLRARAGEVHVVPLGYCGARSDGVTRVFVQDGSGSAQAPFVLEKLALRGPGGDTSLLVSETEAVAAAFDLVADWARAHGSPPVLLGEFGAYGTADAASRSRWTRSVREAAESRDFSWAYWEFGAGFGVYDPSTGAWDAALLAALVDE